MFFSLLKGFLGKFIDAMLSNFKFRENTLIQSIRKVSLINTVYTTQTTSRFPQVLISQQPILTPNPLTFMLLYHI